VTTTHWTSEATGTGRYVEVNGINLYVETHGTGRPLVLLHGGLGSGEMFGPILPALAEHHQVVAVDLQGHGRTADIDRPLDVRLMADDVAALVDHLGLEQPDVMGYSLGAGVALHTAAKHPDKVRRLVLVSANIRRDPRTSPGCSTRSALRWRRTSTTPRMCGVCGCRRWWSPPTPTWHRRATTSRCSRCSTAACGTADGRGRVALPAATRSRSCPA
jgi:pimeloyl-ACP methyl ester carboxylesterase